ncbi:ATPase, AAA family protein [Aduncisulcus paluster]|uniref:ATPase, AAA family protein n=1 Tax=Aduncisulcus paluster TaxID=2918883 RepID=A0ABQ5K4S8_9EUKA|nr:ATPase, AAA family protein [Aduncisulcus paluster]
MAGSKIKAHSSARTEKEKRKKEREKAAIVLVADHLARNGYMGAARALQSETGISLSEFSVCDNVDLLIALQQYEEYQEHKFGRRPHIIKMRPQSASSSRIKDPKRKGALPNIPKHSLSRSSSTSHSSTSTRSSTPQEEKGSIKKGVDFASRKAKAGKIPPKGFMDGFTVIPLTGHSIPSRSSQKESVSVRSEHDTHPHRPEPRDNPPHNPRKHIKVSSGDSVSDIPLMPSLPPSLREASDLHGLAQVIQRDIFSRSPGVCWEDIVGLNDAKRLLKEAVVFPLRYPQLFTGVLEPWKGVLLYGAPGNGKTMLAKAVATECNTTFFNVSATTIVSKFHGESEKLVRVLFEMARAYAPSTVFVDEIDALASLRSGATEHEASRRLKSELLTQMDGLAKSKEQVFVLAATNLPWELDFALLRRLEKRIYIPLPDEPSRKSLLHRLLSGRVRPGVVDSVDKVAEKTDGYSASDLVTLAKEAAICPVRRFMGKLESIDSHIDAVPYLPGSDDVGLATGKEESSGGILVDLGVEKEDLELALKRSKPAASFAMKKYEQFGEKCGST